MFRVGFACVKNLVKFTLWNYAINGLLSLYFRWLKDGLDEEEEGFISMCLKKLGQILFIVINVLDL